MKILGIESSCDDTSAAVLCDSPDPASRILSNVVATQLQEHAPYGGVVPEIASRAHINHISPVISRAMQEANCSYNDLDAIAVTAGPGLIGGVIVGVMTAKAMGSALNKPVIAINHLEGHALTPRITEDVPFPFLMLLVSGGHCQLLIAEDVGHYRLLGKTIDDSLGESFDKVAKMLGMGYPGGPLVEELALKGNDQRFAFPKPLCQQKNCDFSFSGLKTAVLRQIENLHQNGGLTPQDKADICASFQRVSGDILENRLTHAVAQFTQLHPQAKHVVIVGGVAANRYLNQRISAFLSQYHLTLSAPPLALCTDNAAMIAWAAIERLTINPSLSSPLDFVPRARFPLSECQAP